MMSRYVCMYMYLYIYMWGFRYTSGFGSGKFRGKKCYLLHSVFCITNNNSAIIYMNITYIKELMIAENYWHFTSVDFCEISCTVIWIYSLFGWIDIRYYFSSYHQNHFLYRSLARIIDRLNFITLLSSYYISNVFL